MIPDDRLILLDTNVLVQLIRGNDIGQRIDEAFSLRDRTERPLISVVTVGEMLSLCHKLKWGKAKEQRLMGLVRNLVVVQLNQGSVLEKYAAIEFFSEKTHTPARRMGKNDVWIAATAAATGSVLLTTDRDFDHLANTHVELVRWDVETSSVGLSTL